MSEATTRQPPQRGGRKLGRSMSTAPLLASVEAALRDTGGTYQRIAGLPAIEALATVDGIPFPFAG